LSVKIHGGVTAGHRGSWYPDSVAMVVRNVGAAPRALFSLNRIFSTQQTDTW